MQKIVFIVVLLIVNGALGQEIVILDEEDHQPIPNVIVYNWDKSRTALSDFDGKCDLSKFDLGERITFTHIGYQNYRSTKSHVLRKEKLYMTLIAEQLDEVVMSISKWEQQKKDIPQKISLMNAKTIEFTASQTSADLLQNSGKVFVQKSQLGGGSPMIRGFATNRLLLSVDGVRMNNAIFRGGNIQNVISIDPFTIKSTEVIFGPGSVIYGSDAIGGVMNFYTNNPQFSKTDSLQFSGKSNYRYSSANNENTFHVDFNLGKREWAFLSSLTYNNFGDLKMGSHGPSSYLRNNYVVTENGQDELRENENAKKQVPSGYDQINIMQKVLFRPNSNWNINLSAYYSETSDYSRYDRLIRPSKDGLGLRSAEWFYGPQKWFMGNLQFYKNGKGKFYDGLKITTAYQNFGESRNDRNYGDVIRYRTKENVDAISANVDFENKRIGNLRLYYGGEYIFNKIGSTGNEFNIETMATSPSASRYPDNSTWQTLAGYISGELKAKPNFTFLSGLRYSHVWIDAIFDQTFYSFPFNDADLSTGALTGSLGFSWFPKADLQVTFNGSTGFRAPNIDDVGKIFDSEPGSVVVPNPDLEPEYAYNLEVGIQKNFNDRWMLKGASFYTYLVDALVRRDFQFNGNSEIVYNGELHNVQAIQNAAKAYVYGFEFGLDAFLTESLSVNANLTLTEGIEEEQDGTDTPGRHVAPTFGDFHIVWKNQKLKTDLFANFNGEISYSDMSMSEKTKDYIYAVDADGNPYSPSWYTLNFRSQYQFSNAFKFTANLENITDQRYRSYSSGIVAPGINLILGVGYTF
ncbi:TonB-dependent receptor [Arenibacter sp. S6351L]|uniref:TonB-dependent receptor plug domain-containing protein n=1 Tax=Arenibacter sp. S6351L TaxID=2926407 RepID=UPI001FF4C276|nr:TonB-dependent receptor [Arenibacter sp. S6351L]MCK0133131.1 TonB-dependent receptor [Arenibacter sp. S6351L]